MALTSGTRLGAYEIIAPLGAGGMGEVYRARDTNLGRDVALKTLPDRLTHDAERLARFRREAQVLASLNHPHIASIYGLEEAAGHRVLVLELVEGETLAARIARGPLPVDEAIAIAREVAEALEAAHAANIIHRDLKPANIALNPHDRVKVLDFGLAKMMDPAAAYDTSGALNSPTITSPAMMTGAGMILGTAAYMSPEQARGRVADKRSDIWAFGCVLYEMLTGRRAFEGTEVTDTLAAVIKSDPAWDALPPSLPSSIRELLEGCLQKNHRDRIGDISTALFLLKRPPSVPVPSQTPRPAARTWTTWVLLALAGAAVGGAAAVALRPQPAARPQQVARFSIPVPGGALTASRRVVTISPDGSRLAYSADGKLFSRMLAESESRPIPGGDPGVGPAFSPDGQSIVFWADGALKRIPATGGVPMLVCEVGAPPFSLDWSEHGIVFAQPGRGIMRASPNGGQPTPLVALTPLQGLVQSVQLLPDGDTLLFTYAQPGLSPGRYWERAETVVQSLKTGKRKTVMENGTGARYIPTGHLLYLIEGTLLAVPFDIDSLEVKPSPVVVVEGVGRGAQAAGYAVHFDVSSTGALVYMTGPARFGLDDVQLYDRQGNVTPLKLPPGSYGYPRVSPEAKRIALETSDGRETAISLYELGSTNSLRRLTFGGNNRAPLWSADGKRVAFQSDREKDLAIFWQPVDGGPAERLTKPEPGVAHVPESWAPNSDTFLFSATKGTESRLWTYSVRERKASPFSDVVSSVFPTNAAVSPDGRWVAYQVGNDASGEAMLYVQPFPATGDKYEIDRGGRPMWSRDGRELFFVPGPNQFKVVSVAAQPVFAVTRPLPVLRKFGMAPPNGPRPYDILPDGRFVVVNPANVPTGAPSPQLEIVLNWFEELRAKVPSVK